MLAPQRPHCETPLRICIRQDDNHHHVKPPLPSANLVEAVTRDAPGLDAEVSVVRAHLVAIDMEALPSASAALHLRRVIDAEVGSVVRGVLLRPTPVAMVGLLGLLVTMAVLHP